MGAARVGVFVFVAVEVGVAFVAEVGAIDVLSASTKVVAFADVASDGGAARVWLMLERTCKLEMTCFATNTHRHTHTG